MNGAIGEQMNIVECELCGTKGILKGENGMTNTCFNCAGTGFYGSDGNMEYLLQVDHDTQQVVVMGIKPPKKQPEKIEKVPSNYLKVLNQFFILIEFLLIISLFAIYVFFYREKIILIFVTFLFTFMVIINLFIYGGIYKKVKKYFLKSLFEEPYDFLSVTKEVRDSI